MSDHANMAQGAAAGGVAAGALSLAKLRIFERETFFGGYRHAFGRLTQEQVDGLEQLLGFMERDTGTADIRHFAYMLATVKHETAERYHPIEEYGKGRGRRYGQKNAAGVAYYGRGYVQLTWETNYERMTKAWNAAHSDSSIDYVASPELQLQPLHSYFAMSCGMQRGIFTGKKLSDYINEQRTDYHQARRIINGLDKATLVAGYATSFERILKESLTGQPT